MNQLMKEKVSACAGCLHKENSNPARVLLIPYEKRNLTFSAFTFLSFYGLQDHNKEGKDVTENVNKISFFFRNLTAGRIFFFL